MSTTTKSVLAIVVLAVVALIAYFALHNGASSMQAPANGSLSAAAVLPSGTDASDAGLAKDAASIDTSLNGLSTDQASVNQNLAAHVAP